MEKSCAIFHLSGEEKYPKSLVKGKNKFVLEFYADTDFTAVNKEFALLENDLIGFKKIEPITHS